MPNHERNYDRNFDIRHEEHARVDTPIDAFEFGITKLHDLIMSEECGIKHYKTDFLHDVIRITKDLVQNHEKEPATDYRTVIGTRDCGTFTADNKAEHEYWKPSAIKYVGIAIIGEPGSYVTSHIMLKPEQVDEFLNPAELMET